MSGFEAWIREPSTKIGIAGFCTALAGVLSGHLDLPTGIGAMAASLLPILVNDSPKT